MRSLRAATLALAVLSVVVTFSWAQSSTTSLRGTVADTQGAVLVGATVTLENPATGFSRTTKSSSDGAYQFLEVPPSTYTVTAIATGFAPLKRTNVVLQISLPATLNLTMSVKGESVNIEVTGAAPMVNTQDATQGDVFGSRQLIDLPSEGRDPVAILSLQPGVTYIGSNVDQGVDSRGGSVAGARSDQTNVTLDGMDNNDQLTGNAFQGALYTPLDSLQEFRVTTSNSNADAGRSSGAQVNMVTKSGTNSFHGSLYEYNRTSLGEANDYFNKQSELESGLPNRPGQLIRNTFGASLGGPIKKDRLFFFGDYEGQRTREAIQTTREIPSDTLRQGIMMYPCDTSDSNCVAGSNANFSVASDPRVASGQLLVTMTPAGLQSMDPDCQGNGTCPWGGGADPNVANINNANPNAIFDQYPHPNSDLYGDGLNFRAFTFPAHAPIKHDTYILKLDYKLTRNGNHSLFVKGHLMNNHELTPPQFPGDPANDFQTTNSKALMAGYTALFSNTLVNNFRYGFIRQGLGDNGLDAADHNHFRGLDDVQGFTTTVLTNVPVHNFVDDLSWTKGKHTFQFGGNLRLITNNRVGNAQNVSTASSNSEWLANVGISNTGADLDPSAFAGYPLVDTGFGTNYDFSVSAVAGLLPEVFKTYNQDKTGTFFASGAMIPRRFRSTETEFYVQDSWRATPNLVLTGGLRYTLLQPPYETNGNQVAPSVSLHDWFAQRFQSMNQGNTYDPIISMTLSGPANNGKPYWDWNKANLAPRFAFAYSPHFGTGFLHSLFGSSGKSSIRGGYGIYYDHFGMGVVNSFDRNGSFGLTTTLTNPGGDQQVSCAPRLVGLTILPPANPTFCGQEMIPTMTPGFPYTPPAGGGGSFEVAWGLDDRMKTPYSHVFDLSITRELHKNFAFEASYIGRLGRRLLQEVDLAMPLDVKDPKSGMDYFTAATQLTKATNAGTDISQLAPIPFWEDLFPGAAGMLGFGPPGSQSNLGCAAGDDLNATNYSATQAMYDMFSCFSGNETTALQFADGAGGYPCLPACAQLAGQSQQTPYNFYDPQFVSLYAWRTQGTSSYNALQATLRHTMSYGLEFDFTYAFSKSIDVGSNAERINSFEGTGFASQVINAWSPKQLKAVSDFDTKHQLTGNWTYDLPFGHGRPWASGISRAGEAIVGGWSLSGIAHWTSGLPFSVFHGAYYPTDWQLSGTATEIRSPGAVGVHTVSGSPNMFADPDAIKTMGVFFRHPYPGESGSRNELRGPGYFGIDAGLSKSWKIASEQALRFSWETFNVTNSVRFDAAASSNQFDLTTGNFGAYSSTLTKPRVMQLSLRYSF